MYIGLKKLRNAANAASNPYQLTVTPRRRPQLAKDSPPSKKVKRIDEAESKKVKRCDETELRRPLEIIKALLSSPNTSEQMLKNFKSNLKSFFEVFYPLTSFLVFE